MKSTSKRSDLINDILQHIYEVFGNISLFVPELSLNGEPRPCADS